MNTCDGYEVSHPPPLPHDDVQWPVQIFYFTLEDPPYGLINRFGWVTQRRLSNARR